MKNFCSYTPEKYAEPDFHQVEEGIYRTRSPYGDGEIFVTSLSFEMEPESYGEEDGSPRNITQVPFEDLLDEFNIYVTDFYKDLNNGSPKLCYQEFGAYHIEDIQNLRTIIGKRCYAVPYRERFGGGESYTIVIE